MINIHISNHHRTNPKIMIYEIILLLIAGWGAGVVTGLIGASAVAVVIPILVVFAGYDPYTAIAVALSIDVFASSMAAHTYTEHGNIDIKHGVQIAVASVTGALIGSWVSSYIPSSSLGGGSGLITLGIGLFFFLRPNALDGNLFKDFQIVKAFKKRKYIASIIIGLAIGLVCGIVGAGGGMMILLALVLIMDYPIHKAVGTSVLIMIFTAFSGAVAHAYYGELTLYSVFFGGIGGIIGAKSASKFANLSSEKKLKRVVGIAFMALGLMLALFKLVLA